MRQIKFRGKRVDNGKWVYGNLVNCSDCIYIVYEAFADDYRWGFENVFIPIDHATVGQFTGLIDKNGKEIWEGDVLLHKHQIDGNFVDFTYENYLVAFNTKYSGFEYYPIINKHVKQWTTRPLGGDEIEIIGNIHDNPSLLTNK